MVGFVDLLLALLLVITRSLTWDGPDTPHRPTSTPAPAQRHESTVLGLGKGFASWYDAGPGLYGAAGPLLRLRAGWRGSRVRVCAGAACVTVTLTDWCACSPRRGLPTVIDLSPAAFGTLAPLTEGIVSVNVMPDGT